MRVWANPSVVALLAVAWALAGISADAHAQGTAGTTRFKSGLLPPDPGLTANWPTETLTRAYIPDAIDLTPLMPPVADQKGIAACVSYATVYAARGYYSALETGNDPGHPRFTPSPAFVHSQIFEAREPGRTCADSGSATAVAMNYLAAFGTLDLDTVPEDMACSPTISGRLLPRNQFSIAGGAKIVEGAKVTDYHVATIKQRLAAGHPVVVGFDLFKAEPRDDSPATLQILRADEVYQGSLAPNAGPDIGHAMVFVGYDERRKAFRVQNSWGTDWADAGFGWISYEATKADLTSAYTMKTAVPPPVPVPQRPGTARPQVAGTPQCSSLTMTWEVRGNTRHPRLLGFVSTFDMLAALDADHGFGAASEVQVRPWPVCEAMLTLEEPIAAPSRPVIAIDGGRDHLKFGEVLGFGVTTPNFPSFLYLVYLQADGTVVNLVPRRGPIRKQLAPGTTLRFGDGRDGRQTFRVSAPEGPEAIIAIASRSPLIQLEALETDASGQFRLDAVMRGNGNQDNAQDRLWLSLLREAMLDRPDPDMIAREVTADVMHVTVSAN